MNTREVAQRNASAPIVPEPLASAWISDIDSWPRGGLLTGDPCYRPGERPTLYGVFSRFGLMTGLLLTTIVGWGLLACRDDSLLDELRNTKEKACQCQDRACVDALRASSQALEARLQELSAADQDEAQRIAIEMMACLQKI